MKVKKIKLDGNELPERITVELTLSEAVLLSDVLGKISTQTYWDKGQNAEAASKIYDGLEGAVFNRHWGYGFHEADKYDAKRNPRKLSMEDYK